MSAERELRVEATLDAAPDVVWAVLADVGRMAAWSPELVTMRALRPGGLRVGQQYVGVNRRGPVVWPTRSVVVAVEPVRRLAWDTRSSGARWVWELTPTPEGGTGVVHRRPVPRGLTGAGRLFSAVLLGGVAGHADELEAGMATTLAGLAAAVRAAG